MHAAVLAGNRSSALFFYYTISPSDSLLSLPTPPQEYVTSFKEMCSRQNPRNLQLGKKQRNVESLHQCNT